MTKTHEEIEIEIMKKLKEKIDELFPNIHPLQNATILTLSITAFDMILVNEDDYSIDWATCVMKRIANWTFKNTHIEMANENDSDGEGERLMFKEKDLNKFFGFKVNIHIPGYA